MARRGFILAIAGVAAFATPALADPPQWQLGGTFRCVGRSLGNEQVVRVNCQQEVTRGNRITTTVSTFTMQGPAAKHYIGTHEDCWHIDPEDTRINQDVLTCPGVPEWW